LFSLRGLAKYSSIGYSTLQRYLPGIPHYRVGAGQNAKVLVRRSAFDQWLEQYRELGGQPRGAAPDPGAALRAARARRAAGA